MSGNDVTGSGDTSGDDEIREILIAANSEFIEPLTMDELEATVLRTRAGAW